MSAFFKWTSYVAIWSGMMFIYLASVLIYHLGCLSIGLFSSHQITYRTKLLPERKQRLRLICDVHIPSQSSPTLHRFSVIFRTSYIFWQISSSNYLILIAFQWNHIPCPPLHVVCGNCTGNTKRHFSCFVRISLGTRASRPGTKPHPGIYK